MDLEKIAGITHGYVGADLEAVVREAALNALKRESDYEKVIVNEGDFMNAINQYNLLHSGSLDSRSLTPHGKT
ncbi:hypothetical protein [Sulfuracidifex metallicus]|uniref:hypothetical protein n=1 Tax=Sulfuracidifex metallicus TaxID=47303 RepID=UPI00210F0626|nr:hypothetical protein [Sulfuracidifex metallicus]